MQSASAPEAADAVTSFDRWREWALSLRKTSRDNLLTCRADKRTMRHMTILVEDTFSSTVGDLNEAEVSESSAVRELHLEGLTPPAQSRRPLAQPPTHAPARLRQDPPAPRPPTNALTAYPNVDDIASVAEAAMEIAVKAILRPLQSHNTLQQHGPESLRADMEDLRIRDSAINVHDDFVARADDGGAGSMFDAAQRRTGSRDLSKDTMPDTRDLMRAVPGSSLPHPDNAEPKEARLPTSNVLKEDGKGAHRVALSTSTTLQHMVGRKTVRVVPRSEGVDAFHKGQAVAVICPCCATSLLAPIKANARVMTYCPVCESVAPCALCVET